jgi:hypothetical protein
MTHCINIVSSKVNPTMEVSVRKVKTDRIDIQDVYSRFAVETADTFRMTCKTAIEGSSGKKETKSRFLRVLDETKSKDRMLKIVNDFYLAGNGLKV